MSVSVYVYVCVYVYVYVYVYIDVYVYVYMYVCIRSRRVFHVHLGVCQIHQPALARIISLLIGK